MKLIPENSECVYHTGFYSVKARVILNIFENFSVDNPVYIKIYRPDFSALVEYFTIENKFEIFLDFEIVRAEDNELLLINAWHKYVCKDKMHKFLRSYSIKLANALKKAGVKESDRFFVLSDNNHTYKERMTDFYQSHSLKEMKETELLTLKDIRNLGRKPDTTGILVDPFQVELKKECMRTLRETLNEIEHLFSRKAPELIGYLSNSLYRPIEYSFGINDRTKYITTFTKDWFRECIENQLKDYTIANELSKVLGEKYGMKSLSIKLDKMMEEHLITKFIDTLNISAKYMNTHWLLSDLYKLSY